MLDPGLVTQTTDRLRALPDTRSPALDEVTRRMGSLLLQGPHGHNDCAS